MKHISYYLLRRALLIPLKSDDPLVIHWDWEKYDAIKIEIWPEDIKISRCSSVPVTKPKK